MRNAVADLFELHIVRKQGRYTINAAEPVEMFTGLRKDILLPLSEPTLPKSLK